MTAAEAAGTSLGERPQRAQKKPNGTASVGPAVKKDDGKTQNGKELPKEQRTASRARPPALARVAEHTKDTEHRKDGQVTKPRDETYWAKVDELGAATMLAISGGLILDPVLTNMFTDKFFITVAIYRHQGTPCVNRPVRRQKCANDSCEGQTEWENEDLTGTATKAEAADDAAPSPEGDATAKGVKMFFTPLHISGLKGVETMGWQVVWGSIPRRGRLRAEGTDIKRDITAIIIRPHHAAIKGSGFGNYQCRGNSSCRG